MAVDLIQIRNTAIPTRLPQKPVTPPPAPHAQKPLALLPSSFTGAGLPKSLQHPYFRRMIEGAEGSGSADLPAVATIRFGENEALSPTRTATRKTIGVVSAAVAAVLLGLTIAEGTKTTPNPTIAAGTGAGAGLLGIVGVVLLATDPKPSED